MLQTYRQVRRMRVGQGWLAAWAWSVLALAGILNPYEGAGYRILGVAGQEAAEPLSLPPSEAILVLMGKPRPPAPEAG